MRRGFLEVADRVFVARYPQWDVNVGLVLGRDGAVVVDTRASDHQGVEVLDDIAGLGRDIRVSHVVNTHVHFDHTFGNVAFDVATMGPDSPEYAKPINNLASAYEDMGDYASAIPLFRQSLAIRSKTLAADSPIVFFRP